jgi:hypothetical protein
MQGEIRRGHLKSDRQYMRHCIIISNSSQELLLDEDRWNWKRITQKR